MMRIALIVLAFYTAALSCIPCKDNVSTNSYANTVILVNSTSDTSHSPDVDLCTPFCTCSCCASVSLQQQIPFLPAKGNFSIFQEITFAYLSRSHSGDLTSIWQPPRV